MKGTTLSRSKRKSHRYQQTTLKCYTRGFTGIKAVLLTTKTLRDQTRDPQLGLHPAQGDGGDTGMGGGGGCVLKALVDRLFL